MKQKVSLLLALILFTTVLFTASPLQGKAQPAEAPNLTFAVVPEKATMSKPSEPVEIEFTVTIMNNSTSDIVLNTLKLYLGGGDQAETVIDLIKTIGAGNELSIENVDMTVSADMVGTETKVDAEYSGTYQADSTPFSVLRAEDVARFTLVEAPTASIEVSQEASQNIVVKGDSVTITYTIKNTGNIEITNLLLSTYGKTKTDNYKPYSYASLAPDDSVSFKKSITVSETTVSNASVLYDTSDTPDIEKNFDELTIRLQKVELKFNLVASPKASASYGGKINLIYVLENTGNVAVHDIVLKDEQGQVISVEGSTRPFILEPGKDKHGEIEIIVTSTKDYKYKLTGKDPQDNDVSKSTNTISVELISSDEDIKLNISVTADKMQLLEPGMVTFTIDISNVSLFAVKDIKLYDEQNNLIKDIGTLESMQPTSVTDTVQIDQSSNVMYYLTVTGLDNHIESLPVSITIGAEETPAPSDEPTPTGDAVTQTPAPAKIPMGITQKLLIVLYIILALIVLAAAGLVAVNYYQKKKLRAHNTIHRKIK